MTEEEWYTLGRRLRHARRNLDLTSTQLAEKAHTSRVVISALENTRKQGISFALLVRIARELDISLDYLVGRTDVEQEKVGV